MMNTRVISVHSKVPTVPDRSTRVGTPSARERRRFTHEPHPSAPSMRCPAGQRAPLRARPEAARPPARIEDECRRSIEKGEAQRVWRKLVTIQCVVHVVCKTDEENISDAQIESQIDGAQPGLPRHQPRPQQRPRRRGRASPPTRTSSSRSPPRTPRARRPTASPARRRRATPSAPATRSRRRPAAAPRRGRPTATSTSGSATSATGCSATRSSPAARPRPTAS